MVSYADLFKKPDSQSRIEEMPEVVKPKMVNFKSEIKLNEQESTENKKLSYSSVLIGNEDKKQQVVRGKTTFLKSEPSMSKEKKSSPVRSDSDDSVNNIDNISKLTTRNKYGINENKRDFLIRKYDSVWKKFSNTLEDEELEAVMLYTYRNRDITRYLQGENHIKTIYYKDIEDIIKHIDSAINKFKITNTLVAFKGTNRDYFDHLKVGDTFTLNHFFSTTLLEDVAVRFMENSQNYHNPLLVRVVIPRESKGLYVGFNAGWQNNNEVILPRNTKFKVVDFDNNVLKLKVIP